MHHGLYVYSFVQGGFRQLTLGAPKSLFARTKDVFLIPFATALYLEDTYICMNSIYEHTLTFSYQNLRI